MNPITPSMRRRHPLAWIVVLLPVLLGLDAVAWLLWWAWHLMPWLLGAGAVVLACRRWGWHLRAAAWLAGRRP